MKSTAKTNKSNQAIAGGQSGCCSSGPENSTERNFLPIEGIELGEARPYGHNSAWAPEGRQSPSNDGSTNQISETGTHDPTHIGRTQSTTNSQ